MPENFEQARLVVPVSSKRDHIRGDPAAGVSLVEYGDFECPHCGAAHFVLDELLAQVGDQLLFVFRHFPLTTLHPHAQRAAEAAEAAGTQARFWEMHDVLFERQDALEDEDLIRYADELRLDVGRFEAELISGIHTERVREDVSSGIRSGVNGTPTFFINGLRHDGPWDLESLRAAIEPHLAHRGAERFGRRKARR